MALYTPEQHSRYDGHFVLSASRIYQVGQLDDPPGWDHMGNDASNVHGVKGSVEIDVDEIKNTGHFIARLTIPEGELVLEMTRFHEFSSCQDGGLQPTCTNTVMLGVVIQTGLKRLCLSPAGATGRQR